MLESPVFAQAEIVVSPKTVTINGTRGETITRTIAVRTSEEINDVKAIALDAFSADNSVVLPSAAIEITTPPTQISVNELTSFPLRLNLQSAPSGEFTGEILLTYTGGEKSIPLIVRVKDPWLLPLMTLLVGIAISMAVSAYSSEGKLSDEVTLSLKNISTQIDSDKAEARSFWSRAAMYLTIAKQAQDGKQFVLAQTELDKAKAVWNKWLEQRPNWLIQFRYYDSLRQRLEQNDLKNSSALYVQEINRDLEQTLQNSPDLSTPDKLKQRFDELSKQLNRYIRLKLQLEKLKGLIAVLEGEQRYEWEDKADDLTQRSQILLPSQDDEAQKLEDEINTSIEKVRELGANAAETFKSVDGNIELGLVLQPPSVKGAKPQEVFGIFPIWQAVASLWQTANGRLRLFYLSSYLISFIVLAGGGFNQLYWTKSTFGANGWGDYFALLAWGFGAEATRKVVTQVAGKTDS
ncbi:hypothetical protein [Gloeothece verrucosa]|uniref:hypothetical protein n=1 Tax=Gloeothece verrucosa TaxID=2546359 RepID=UPI0012FF0592|nr:hypothetical protein [Gloeothece verrucosa]